MSGFCHSSVKTPHIGGTDGAVRGEPSSLGLSRVVTEVDKVKFGRGWMSLCSFLCARESKRIVSLLFSLSPKSKSLHIIRQ